MKILLFVILFLSLIFGSQIVFYVSPTSTNCDLSLPNQCQDVSNPCDLFCPFSLPEFNSSSNVVVKLLPGTFLISEARMHLHYFDDNQETNGTYFLTELSTEDQNVTIESYSDEAIIDVIFPPFTKNASRSVFFINVQNLDITLRNFQIRNVGKYYGTCDESGNNLFKWNDQKFRGQDDPIIPPENLNFRLDNIYVFQFDSILGHATNVISTSSIYENVGTLFTMGVNSFPNDHEVVIWNTDFLNASCPHAEVTGFWGEFITITDFGNNTFCRFGHEYSVNVDIWKTKFIGFHNLNIIDITIPRTKLSFVLEDSLFENLDGPTLMFDAVSTSIINILNCEFRSINISESYGGKNFFKNKFVFPAFLSARFFFPDYENVDFHIYIKDSFFEENELDEVFQIYFDMTHVRLESKFIFPILGLDNTTFRNNIARKNLISIIPQGFGYSAPINKWGIRQLLNALYVKGCIFESNQVSNSEIFLYRFGTVDFENNDLSIGNLVVSVTVEDSKFFRSSGSCLYLSGAFLEIRDSEFVENKDTAVRFLCGTLRVYSSIFLRNRAKNYGGAFQIFDLIRISDEISFSVIWDSQFIDNSATNGGGAIYLGGEEEEMKENSNQMYQLFLCIENVTFVGNNAPFGGAIQISDGMEICVLFGDRNVVGLYNHFDGNFAMSGGGAIYVNEPRAFWSERVLKSGVDPLRCVGEKLVKMTNNYVLNELTNERFLEYNVLTAPKGLFIDPKKKLTCQDKSFGQNYWVCKLDTFWVVDFFGSRIISPTYKEHLIHLTVKEIKKTVSKAKVTFSTHTRTFSADYDNFTFFAEYDKVEDDVVSMAIDFMGVVSETKLHLGRGESGLGVPGWLLGVVFVSMGSLLIVMFFCMLCAVCCVCLFCCFVFCGTTCWILSTVCCCGTCCACLTGRQLYSHEKKSRIEGSEQEFENYDDLILQRRVGAASINTTEGFASTGMAMSISPEVFEEEEEEGEKKDREITDELKEELIKKWKKKSLKIGPNHVFQGDPVNGEGAIFFVERISYLKGKVYYPVFSGFFRNGKKEGNGIEYYYIHGKGLSQISMEKWKSVQKSGRFVEKFAGKYKNGLKHGFGTEYQNTKPVTERLKGKWNNGSLMRIFSIDYPLKVIDFKKEIRFGDPIGKGGFATVYRANYRPVNKHSSKKNRVAVKLFDPNRGKMEGEQALMSFENLPVSPLGEPGPPSMNRSIKQEENYGKCEEIGAILKRIKMFNHPNIVQIIGWTGPQFNFRHFGYVMEMCACSVRDYYHKHEMKLSLKDKILLECAMGVECFHDQCGLIHRDVKLSNLLLSSKDLLRMTVKLCDFNLGLEDFKKIGRFSVAAAGSPFHCPPESFFDEFNYKCDVYSFAIVMYELYYDKVDDPFDIVKTGRCPICRELMDINGENLVFEMEKHHNLHKNQGGLRPVLEDLSCNLPEKREIVEEIEGEEEEDFVHVRKRVGSKRFSADRDDAVLDLEDWRVKLIQQCWAPSPKSRPSFKEIVRTFKTNM